jgi:hypothetical protein
MKKESRAKIRLIDILVVLLCLTGAMGAFYFFWQDLNKSLVKDGEPIADVYVKKKTAQRRFSDRVVWDMLKKDSPVYLGDVVHTADESEATIYYRNGGNNFDLKQNSLVQIFENRVEFATGEILMRAEKDGVSLKLVQAGTTIEIAKNSTISANAMQSGGGNIQVLEGTARIITSEGVENASAGEAMSVSSDGKKEIVEQVIPISPKPGLVIPTSASKENVVFSWRTANFNEKSFVRFQLASDQNFSNVIRDADIRNSTEQTLSLESGTYYWRVYAISDESRDNFENAISNKLVISAVTPVKLLLPKDSSVISYRNAIPPVRLQWDGGETEDFLLEVADNPAMQSPGIIENVDNSFFTASNLGEGMWYWRVSTILDGITITSSRVSSFALRKNVSSLEAPTLNTPVSGAQIGSDFLFSWKQEEDAEYTLQISRNSEFIQSEISRTMSENYFSSNKESNKKDISELGNGQYFWRVSYKDSTGAVSPFSPIRTFTVSPPVPVRVLYPPENFSVSEGALRNIRFTWQPEVRVTFQVSRTENFSVILQAIEDASSGMSALQLESGSYYWRIATDAYSTAPRRINVTEIQRIVLESPVNNVLISGEQQSTQSLRWSTTEQLARSRLLISENSNPAISPLFQLESPARSTKMPKLREGTYYWTIEAESRSGVSITPAAPAVFRIEALPLLAQVNLQTPSNNSTITAAKLRTDRNIRFAWSASQEANSYILSIYSSSNRNTPVFRSQIISTNSYVFSNLELLDAGGFVWTVEPIVSTGAVIDQHGAIRESRFTIDINIPKSITLPDERTYGE